jgi:hypothetical protein
MTRFARVCLSGLLVLVVVAIPESASSQEPILKEKSEQTWVDVAKQQELSDAQIKLLREQKFFVTEKTMKQVFSAYLGGGVPVFITSDSILNAYHVLLEESIYRMELAHSRKLPGVLEHFTKNLEATAAKLKEEVLPKAAKKRAAIFLGVARNLVDEQALPGDADMKAEVQEEVKRIVAASGASKPAWLGSPDDGFRAIDYSRFKPRGFYSRTPALQRYFCAASWLQTIPFRADRDEELAAFVLMHVTYFDRDQKPRPDASIWHAFREFLGDQDDWDLSTWWLPHEPNGVTKNTMEKLKSDLASRDGAELNDQLRYAPTEAGAKTEFAFRFLSAYRLPDAVMFHRTMRPKELKRDFPSGLEVAAALGSPFARDKIKKYNPKLLAEIDATRPLFKSKNLYADYLKCLGVLMERVEPDAPEFMRGEPWRIKTAQTALAGWAQMRHTWVLQAKLNEHYLSASRLPSGFVEPVPEFYDRLATLVDDTARFLKATGVLEGDPKEFWREFGEDVRTAQALVKQAIEKKAKLSSFTPAERELLLKLDVILDDEWKQHHTEAETLEILGRSQRDLVRYGELVKKETFTLHLSDLQNLKFGNLAQYWTDLSKVCHRLEVLAHKQLRQVPWSEEDNKFIRGYGARLAGIMFYSGNSYFDPRDDAMRVVDVYSNSAAGGHLHVGIARPRVMWVLYPTKNGEVLCRGAIIPYAEFTQSSRLTDGEWKSLLDSPKRPGPPSWAKDVISPEAKK